VSPLESYYDYCDADCHGQVFGGYCNECLSATDCDWPNEACNTQRCCVPVNGPQGPGICGGSCSTNGDCCYGNICTGNGSGQGRCVAPNSLVCPNAPSCNSDNDCDRTTNDCYAGNIPNQYCDASIGRCMRTLGNGCVGGPGCY
jgi:hypothetical protein